MVAGTAKGAHEHVVLVTVVQVGYYYYCGAREEERRVCSHTTTIDNDNISRPKSIISIIYYILYF